MNWTFGRKLALGFSLAVVTVVVIGVSGYRATTQLIENDRWVAHSHEVRRAIGNALSAVKDAETGQRGFLLTGDERFLEPYRGADAAIAKALADLRRLTADNPEQQQRLVALSSIINARLQRLANRIELRRSQGFEAVAKPAELDQGKQQMEQVRSLAGEMDHVESALLAQRKEESERSARDAHATIFWGSLLGTLLVVLAGAVISRSLAVQVGVAVRHIQTSASELQAAANQQATGAKEQATAMSEVTTTIRELLATSRQIAESARRVAEIASRTASQARSGDANVLRGTEAVGVIKRQVDAIVNHMLELGRKSQQIGAVLDMVAELAEQTNILAINATVEAARAGESGRRFGVVADEIRKLAERVAASSKEIRGLIEDVRGAVNTTVMTTESGAKAVDAGSDQFNLVAASFGEISTEVLTALDAAKEIELSTQQASAVEQVNIAITSAAQASKEGEVSTGQTLRTASELATLSRGLLRLVEAQGPPTAARAGVD